MLNCFQNYLPVRIIFGANSLSQIGYHASLLGKKALIVTTGPYFEECGLINRIKKILAEADVTSCHYDAISPNPQYIEVDRCAAYAREQGVDLVIGLGGGSAMDAAKGVAVAVKHEGSIWDYIWWGKPDDRAPDPQKTLPIITVTTTSGTGSHVTPYSVLTNPETHEKPSVAADALFAKVAIVDPELMLTLPPKITASTGFDILFHSEEGYTSLTATPLTDLYNEKAIALVGQYLPRAVQDGSDIEARTALAFADTLAGFSLSVASITLNHALGHAIGGISNTSHGECLCATALRTMQHNSLAACEKYLRIGGLLTGQANASCIEETIQTVDRLLVQNGMKIKLSQLGIKTGDFSNILRSAKKYMGPSLEHNPRTIVDQEVIDILSKSM